MAPGYDALRAMGDRGWGSTAATILAEALYGQGRLDQALRLTEEAEELAGPDDFDAQARWRVTRAKVLARRGQHHAAVQLAQETVALVPAASGAPELAEFLVAQAEVCQLAGALDQAEASLRKALSACGRCTPAGHARPSCSFASSWLWSFASGGRRSAAQDEETPSALPSRCRLVDGACNNVTAPAGGRPSRCASVTGIRSADERELPDIPQVGAG